MKEYTKEILGVTYKYRGATRSEIEEAIRLPDMEMEDFLCSVCVTPKIDVNTCIAALPTILAECILEVSGMTEAASKALHEDAENWISTVSGKIESLMMGMLHVRMEDIEKMSPKEWHRSSMAAQMIAASVYGLDINAFLGETGKKKIQKANEEMRRPSNMYPPLQNE